MRTIEGTTTLWLSSEKGPDDLLGTPEEVLTNVFTFPYESDWENYGYTNCGSIRFEITLNDDKQLVDNKVEALKGEKTKILAEAQAKATEIDRKIQTLLAITYEA